MANTANTGSTATKKKNEAPDFSLNGNAPFSVIEAYKTIRTNIMFALPQKEKKVITITSALPGEGKSTTALNIGISFSQLEQRVIVIDGDMRKPTLYKKLKINNQMGLSSVLGGFCELSEAIKNVYPNFDVMTSGPLPPNPAELLGSENMAELLEALKQYYDCIIVDTPPINVVTDSVVIATKTDGIVMVLRHGVTTHDEVKKALSSIEFSNVKLLGTVVNGVKYTGKKYKSKYHYKYSYKSKG